MALIRQGDVNIGTTGTQLWDGSVVGEIPAEATPVESPIIARGEHSGHCHAVRKTAPGGLMALGETLWISARGKVQIDHTHETQIGEATPPRADHYPITVPQNGQILIEREYEI